MKRVLHYLQPLLFALSALVLYIIIFHPAPGSVRMATAVMVFSTSLGSMALIVFTVSASWKPIWVYIGFSLAIPPVLLWGFHLGTVDYPLHPVLFAIMGVGFIVLKWFIGYHLRSSK